MEHYVTAMYEQGVLKPLGRVDLQEKQIVTLRIIPSEKAVLDSKGMVKGNPTYINEIAESKELLEWNP
jgi:predicted DNA-binding antitoxin AbrB/MazE fold protein